MKNGEIILCNNIKLDKNYENVLSYSESNMVNLCRQHAIYTGTKYTMMDPSTNEIDIRCPYATCIYSNYIAFNNKNVGNKWYFAFVTDIIYVNPEVTKIRYQVDVFSTWYQRFNLNQAFIEREHVEDDSLGKHVVEENLEIGDLIIQDKVKSLDDYEEFCIVMGVTQLPGNYSGVTLPLDRQYNSVYSGLIYLVPSTPTDASKIIEMYEHQEQGDAIVEIFMYYLTQDIQDATEYTMTHPVTETSAKLKFIPTSWLEDTVATSIKINLPTQLDGYTPKNNKMFTSPYCFINADNNAGIVQQYKWELFTLKTETGTNNKYADFSVISCVCPGGSAKAIPKARYAENLNYGTGVGSNYMYSIPLAKLPICSWLSDTYTNWLTQNGIASTGISQSLMAVGGGLLTQNYIGVAVGIAGIMSAIGEIKDKKNAPDIVKGNTNSGDINFAYQGDGGFNLYTMVIKYDAAKRIDDFFSRFGYKVNEVKVPNLTSRTKFNFIKVGGMDELVTGSIPASDLETINAIFRKGVTIFHNYNDVGNYLVDNPIVE